MPLAKTLKFIVNHPLNRGQRVASMARFAAWQIRSRFAQAGVVHEWVGDSRFLAKRGESGLTGNIYTGLHEFPDMGFLLHFLRSNDVFVDVGANAGSYTILACAVAGATGIAFEPIPGTFDRLAENLRLNHLEQRVIARNQGVGAIAGTLQFTSNMDCVNHALAVNEQHGDSIGVEVTTLDDSLRGHSPLLMKIDVEGYETPVLEGARETLQNPSLQAVIMELNGSGTRYGFDESRALRMLLDTGFNTYAYAPFTRQLASLDGKNLESGNTLFIRDLAFVKQRLHDAPIVRVHGREF